VHILKGKVMDYVLEYLYKRGYRVHAVHCSDSAWAWLLTLQGFATFVNTKRNKYLLLIIHAEKNMTGINSFKKKYFPPEGT
jgi:hypothetical protein